MKKSVLILLLTLSMFPLLNMFVFPEMIDKLEGYVVLASKPECSIESWFDKSFQDKYEAYINDNIGFRPFFVRIRNQILFSLFNEVRAAWVIRGKEDYLYELNYIKEYNGDNFIGSKKIKTTVSRLDILRDSLEARGKSLLIVLAPGKGTFYPQYFPEEYQKPATDSTNYKVFRKVLSKKQLNVIDFNKWLLEVRDTCGCLLYPKYGIHWSQYAMLLAADSIVNYIESIRNIDMPNLQISGMERTDKLRFSDYDIAEGMNLLFQMQSEPMCYPKHSWQQGSYFVHPRTIVVADSFYWEMFNTGIGSGSFSLGGFWYYNQSVYPDSFSTTTEVKGLDIKKKIEENDVFIIISTEANLFKFDFGFTDGCLNALGYSADSSAVL